MASATLTRQEERNPLNREFSRRSFHRFASLLAAGAALPFYNERALAQLSMLKDMPPDAVKINANENPMGPCPEAAEAKPCWRPRIRGCLDLEPRSWKCRPGSTAGSPIERWKFLAKTARKALEPGQTRTAESVFQRRSPL